MLPILSDIRTRDMSVFALGAITTFIITPGLGRIAAGIRDSIFSSVSSAFYLGMVIGMGTITYIGYKNRVPVDIRFTFPNNVPAAINRPNW